MLSAATAVLVMMPAPPIDSMWGVIDETKRTLCAALPGSTLSPAAMA